MTDASLWEAAVLRSAAAQTPAVTHEEDLFFARAVLQTLVAAPAGRDAGAAQTRKQKACTASLSCSYHGTAEPHCGRS